MGEEIVEDAEDVDAEDDEDVEDVEGAVDEGGGDSVYVSRKEGSGRGGSFGGGTK